MTPMSSANSSTKQSALVETVASRMAQKAHSKKTRKKNLPPPTRHGSFPVSTPGLCLVDLIFRNIRPHRNKRPLKTVIFQRGEYTKPKGSNGRFFQWGRYTKPMGCDGFWNVFLLLLKIKRPGCLFRQIRYCIISSYRISFTLLGEWSVIDWVILIKFEWELCLNVGQVRINWSSRFTFSKAKFNQIIQFFIQNRSSYNRNILLKII